MKPVEAVVLGAGERGTRGIGGFAQRYPEELQIIAVAEPDEGKRQRFARLLNLPAERCFRSWEELMALEQLAPVCFNMTIDPEHLPSSLAALQKGYHLLLEKPMAPTPQDCLRIAQEAEHQQRLLQIFHPLRFTNFYGTIRDILEREVLGEVIAVTMQENVGYWHFAHSYVRGNWRRSDTSGPSILTKCCHDMDLIIWYLGQDIERVTSVGSLGFFRSEMAPAGATARCTDPCPHEPSCPFAATRLYLTERTEWPTSVISVDGSLEARRRALEQGPYGRCVFHCDNDVVDHQMVAIEFKGGATASFSLNALTNEICRTVRVIGTLGELNGHFEKADVSVHLYAPGYGTREAAEHHGTPPAEGAHGGGDVGVIRNFLRAYNEGKFDALRASTRIAVEAHLLSFAAEEARKSSQVVSFPEYARQYGFTL